MAALELALVFALQDAILLVQVAQEDAKALVPVFAQKAAQMTALVLALEHV